MNRQQAEQFASELPNTISDAPALGRFAWDVAASKAGVDGRVAVVHPRDLVFLLGEEWIIEPDDNGSWTVRPWQHFDDPRFGDHQEMMNP